MDIKPNQLLQTYPKWGPNYKVEFNIHLLNTPNGNGIYNILHVTEVDSVGSEHNLLVSVKNGNLHISSNDGRFIYDYEFEISQEYNIIIEQTGMFLPKYF